MKILHIRPLILTADHILKRISFGISCESSVDVQECHMLMKGPQVNDGLPRKVSKKIIFFHEKDSRFNSLIIRKRL